RNCLIKLIFLATGSGIGCLPQSPRPGELPPARTGSKLLFLATDSLTVTRGYRDVKGALTSPGGWPGRPEQSGFAGLRRPGISALPSSVGGRPTGSADRKYPPRNRADGPPPRVPSRRRSAGLR